LTAKTASRSIWTVASLGVFVIVLFYYYKG
jgi:hypothetical protein